MLAVLLLALVAQTFKNVNDPSIDRLAPVVTIVQPTSAATYDAGAAVSVTIAGTALDTAGIAICRFSNAAGGAGNATTTSPTASTGDWSVSVALTAGENVITVSCLDAFNNAGVDTITVTRTAGVTIAVGQDAQAIIDGQPPGTVYTLLAGTFRMVTMTPKTGDTFQGVTGTILSGARVLTSWTQDGARWFVTGQTQQGTVGTAPGSCLAAYPRCNYPEDVFFDNVMKIHVATLAECGAGEWFFDYVADRIYVCDDPDGHTVETSVTARPFLQGSATGVTVRTMVIEKFAAPTSDAAVGCWSGWSIFQNTVRWNHGGGIYQVDTCNATQNVVTYNCGMSMQGAGSGLLVFQNEISYGNVRAGTEAETCGYDPYWGAGCSKWVFTVNLIVRGNYVHHCYGPGLWADISNDGGLIEDNVVSFNRRSGIFWELSYDAIIQNNTLTQNGNDTQFGDYPTNGCIEVTSSANVEVYGNNCIDNYNGIISLDDNRNGTGGEFNVVNLSVHDNLIDQRNISAATGFNGLLDFEDNSPTGPAYQPAANNHWQNNRYCFGSDPTPFYWDGSAMTLAQWQAQGHDTGDTSCP